LGDFQIEKIIEVAGSAADIILKEPDPIIARRRSSSDYTTATDLEVEEYICSRLEKLVPEAEIIAEESIGTGITSHCNGPAFIVDPIDGTINFFHDYKASAISIAYMENGKLLHGVVLDPYKKEVFSATRGKGAFLNGEPIYVSKVSEMKDALSGFGTSPYNKKEGLKMLASASRVYESCQDIRRLGAAALDLVHVACGRLDLFFETGLKPWDFYAGMLIIQEAGGLCSDWAGQPVEGMAASDICASNGILHPLILRLLYS